MRSALIDAGVVVNVIVGEIEGSVPCPDDVSVGWTFDGAPYHPPAPTVEEEPAPMPDLSRRQMLLGLLSIGITEAMVDARIEEIADPTERAAASIEWRNAGRYQRSHWLVTDLATEFSLPPEQVDMLWQWSAVL